MQLPKEKVILHYTQSVSDKIKALQKQQEDLLESLRHETKSTAGDKYETSRAMLHMEQENIAAQLSVLLRQKAILESISGSHAIRSDSIQLGSLIQTDKGTIFVAAALGKLLIEGRAVFAISPESPLGRLMIGKTTGEKVQVQSVSYVLEAIY